MTPDQDLSARLLPCPFCGGKAHNYSQSRYWIGCKECGADMPIEYDEGDALLAWNRRSPITLADHTAAVQAAVAKAVKAERAECAKRIDNEVKVALMRGPQHVPVLTALAAAIRSRGVAG